MNTLFLSASTGGGHDKAAEAVMECMKHKNPDSNMLLSNSLKHISPLFDRLITGTYLHTMRNTPNVYGTLYELSEKAENITDITKTLNRLLSYRLSDFIDTFAPSVIVSTHTFPLQMISSLKRKGKLSVPAVGIITDYTHHYFWKLDNIDAFIVAHDYIKDGMIKMGISSNRIHTYGIPVGRSFLEKWDRSILLSEFGLQARNTILVMGGSLGFGEIEGVFSSLLKCERDIQILVVAGLNYKLENKLKELATHTKKAVRIFGYTDRISDLMDISDLIITKPGGVSIAEALIKQLPIILMTPLPGQEERNARFLLNTGAAVQLFQGDAMDSVLHQILDNSLKIRQMKDMAKFLAHPEAAEKTVALIEDLTKGSLYNRNVAGISCTPATLNTAKAAEAFLQKY